MLSFRNSFVLSILNMLGLMLIILKLSNATDLSWWWIMLPFWGEFTLSVLPLMFIILKKDKTTEKVKFKIKESDYVFQIGLRFDIISEYPISYEWQDNTGNCHYNMANSITELMYWIIMSNELVRSEDLKKEEMIRSITILKRKINRKTKYILELFMYIFYAYLSYKRRKYNQFKEFNIFGFTKE